MPNDGNYTSGKNYPTPADPENRVCLLLEVPDAVEYRAAVLGQLGWLADWRCWKHTQSDYNAPPDVNREIAALFAQMLVEATFEECMEICEQVAECISEENPALMAALTNWMVNAINSNAAVQTALQNAFNPAVGGQEIPQEYAEQNQYGAALGCDNNDGWGHIREGLVDRSFDRVQQVLERIEFVTDNQEMLAEFVNAIPGVGAFFDVIPVTDWILWFDNVRATIKEAFEAGDSFDLRDQIACDLFCIWKVECSLSVEQIRDYYWTKTVEILPSWEGAFESFASLGAALSAFTSVSIPEQAVYALVGSQYGFLTFINDWFGIHINATANDLAMGEPSDDWIALCDDCPEDTVTVTNVGLFGECGTGVIETVEATPGVPFEMTAYEIIPALGAYAIALRLPVGNWQVTMNSFIGTVIPPADLNQDAYAYWDTTSTLIHVPWNTPASPDGFGTQDTNQATFSAWCSTETFNAVIFNDGAFSVSFTITAL